MNTAEVKLDALELIARFSHAMDGRDPEAFLDLFAEDAVFTLHLKAGEVIKRQGREELSEYISSLYRERGDDQPRHHVRNTIFLEATDHKVMTSTYFLLTLVSGKGGFAAVSATGIFKDEMVLTPQGWKIKERTVVYD